MDERQLTKQQFALWLEQRIADRGFTAAKLGRLLDTSQTAAYNWVRGRAVPSPQVCQRLAEVLSVPLTDVLQIAGHMPGDQQIDPASIDWRAALRAQEGEAAELVIKMANALLETLQHKEQRRRGLREKGNAKLAKRAGPGGVGT